MLKRCKFCGGEPRWLYYAIPKEINPDLWEPAENGEFEPTILLKRIECKNCKATTILASFPIDCDHLEIDWNSGTILQYWSEESPAVL